MPYPVVVSAPTPLYSGLDVTWPANDVAYDHGGALVNACIRNGVGVAAAFGAIVGAPTMRRGFNQCPGAVFSSSGAGGTMSANVVVFRAQPTLYPLLTGAGYPAYPQGYKQPEWTRVWRWQFTLQSIGTGHGIYTFAGFGTESSVPAATPESGAKFCGIMGNGAGYWRYVSRNIVGAAFQESVPLGIGVGWSILWDLVIINGEAVGGVTIPAVLQLYANGAQILERPWSGAMPDCLTGPATVNSNFGYMVGCTDAAIADSLLLGPCRWTQGQFTVNGVAV